ncbi:hypothetical protein ACJX0J_005162 [Zea mays]
MTATIFSILRIPILFEKKSKEKKKKEVLFLQFFFLEILEKFSFKTDSCFTEEKREFRLFHINGSTFMFLLHEYDIFWTFLIIASLIPILVFWISGLLAPVSEGPEKTHGGAWLQFRIRYYMFALVLFFDVLGVSVFIEAFIFTLNTDSYSTVRGVDKGSFSSTIFKLAFEIDQDNAAGCRDFTNKSGGLGIPFAVILYVYGYNYLRSQCAYDSLPQKDNPRIPDNKFMFTYTTQFQILFKASFLFSNLENHIFCLEIYLLTLEIYLLTLD